MNGTTACFGGAFPKGVFLEKYSDEDALPLMS